MYNIYLCEYNKEIFRFTVFKIWQRKKFTSLSSAWSESLLNQNQQPDQFNLLPEKPEKRIIYVSFLLHCVIFIVNISIKEKKYEFNDWIIKKINLILGRSK